MTKKKYAFGGEVDASQQPAYFSGADQQQTAAPAPGVNQTFNIQPSASSQPGTTTSAASDQPTASSQGIFSMPKLAKGGTVSSASKRGDGCVQRGRTRGKMV